MFEPNIAFLHPDHIGVVAQTQAGVTTLRLIGGGAAKILNQKELESARRSLKMIRVAFVDSCSFFRAQMLGWEDEESSPSPIANLLDFLKKGLSQSCPIYGR